MIENRQDALKEAPGDYTTSEQALNVKLQALVKKCEQTGDRYRYKNVKN